MRARNTMATGVALVLSVAGCRQVLDTKGYGTKGPRPTYTGKWDGVLYVSKSCRDCVDAECRTEAAGCAADPACAAKAQCLAACAHDDHECRGKCNLSIPDTHAMRALVQCEALHDACSECGSSRAVWSGEACDACLAETCPPAALDAFSQDKAALDRRACEEDCPDPKVPPYCGCRGEVEGNTDAGADAPVDAGEQLVLTQVQSCADDGRCNAACGRATPDWKCLGSVQWPAAAPTLTRLELHVRLVTVTDESPLAGESVEACSEIGGCGALGAKTAPDGWASLELTRQTTGDRFFQQLTAPDSDLDALLYLFPPVRESPSWRKFRLLIQSVAATTPLKSVDGMRIRLDWADQGGIAWSVAACNKAPAAGVVVSIDSGEQAFYSSDSILPTLEPAVTSEFGTGVFVNIAPGLHKLTAQRVQPKQLIGTYSVQVLAGKITHVTMVPTPEGG